MGIPSEAGRRSRRSWDPRAAAAGEHDTRLRPSVAAGPPAGYDRLAKEFWGTAMRLMRPAICLGLILAALPARAAEKLAVDLALVLAVDVSLSVDEGEKGLQRVGYIAAWRDKRVADAIRNGPIGRLAVTFVEWSSPYQQAVVIPWRIIDGPMTATAFADELEKAPITPGTTTSISGGLDFSVKLLQKKEHDAARMVIDVSGDGYSDVGRPVTEARDAAVKAGITINGLPVINEDPKKNAAPPDLDTYYRDNVIGGPGSFYVVSRNVEGFKESLLKKLVLEIAGLTPDQATTAAER